MKYPGIDPNEEVLQSWTTISTTQNIIIEHDGFLKGTSWCSANGTADLRIGNHVFAGVTYLSGADRIEVPFCVPIKSGTEVQVLINGTSSVRGLEVIKAVY